MRHFNIKNPTAYFAFAVVVVFVLLKYSILSIVPEMAESIIPFAPLVIILVMASWAFYKSQKGESAKHLLPLTLKCLLIIVAFYIFYSPNSFWPILMAIIGFFKDWDAGTFFLILVYFLGLAILCASVFLIFRFWQKSRGEYDGSMSRLVKITLYILFFIFLLSSASSVLAYPDAWSPAADTLGDLVYTVSAGNILAFKGSDPQNYQGFKSLQDFSVKLSKSVQASSANFVGSIAETQNNLKDNITNTKTELHDSFVASIEDMKKSIESDINKKLSLSGGTIDGDLVIKKTLTSDDTLNAKLIDLGTNTIEDGIFKGDWDFSEGRIFGLSSIDTGEGSTKVYLMNQNIRSSDSPTFAGLTLSGDLALGYNTLTTSNTAIVANLNADLLDGQHGSYYLPAGNLSGTSNYLAKFNGTKSLTDSVIYESGGKVGIGTSSPETSLDVVGYQMRLTNYEGNPLFLLRDDAENYGGVQWNSANNYLKLYTRENNASYNNTLILKSGNVGIGTTSPSNILTIAQAADSNGLKISGYDDMSANNISVYVNSFGGSYIETNGLLGITSSSAGVISTGSYLRLRSIAGNYIELADNNSANVRMVSGGGSVSIGTTTAPTSRLYVQGSGSTSATSALNVLNSDGISLLFVRNDGNVGIGTTSPTYKLDVVGGIFASANSNFNGTYVGVYNGNQGLYTGGADLGFTSWRDSAVTTNMVIKAATGNVGIGTTNPAQQLEITKNFRMPNTTFTAQYGVIYKGADRFIHDFNYGDNNTVTTLGRNTFVGIGSGNFTMGSTATIIYHASQNTAVGYQTLDANTTGYRNAAIGDSALGANTTGYHNTAIGQAALRDNTTGFRNTAIGNSALVLSNGYNNTAVGDSALSANISGSNNVALGEFAGAYELGSNSFYVNNINQTNTANDKAYSLLYGTFSGTAGSLTGQQLVINGNVGIGTTSPISKIHVSADGVTPAASLYSASVATSFVVSGVSPQFNAISAENTSSLGGYATFKGTRARGTLSSPTSPLANDAITALLSNAYDGTATGGGTAGIYFYAEQNIATGVAPQRISFITSETNNLNRIERLTIKANGNVGIGATNPAAMLQVGTSAAGGNVRIDNGWLCVDSDGSCTGATAAGTVYAVNAYTTGADYAEYFKTKDTDLKSGEAVCVDVTEDKAVKRCENDGDNNIMGIVSTKPSVVGNRTTEQANDPDHYKIIGMMGQVAGLVSTENGDIRIGDNLTASSIPGYMRKVNAGESTVGVAMENFKGTKGTIQILISRRNQSLTVEKVEEAVTENIASMNLKDQVANLVSQASENLNEQIETLSNTFSTTQKSLITAEITSAIDPVIAMQTKLQNQMDLIEEQNKVVADFIDILDTKNIVYKNEFGDLNLLGKLTAPEIEADKIKAKDADLENVKVKNMIQVGKYSEDPEDCTKDIAGAIYFNAKKESFYGCNGKEWKKMEYIAPETSSASE